MLATAKLGMKHLAQTRSQIYNNLEMAGALPSVVKYLFEIYFGATRILLTSEDSDLITRGNNEMR